MITDVLIKLWDFICALIFNNWADAVLEKIQFLFVCFDNLNNGIVVAVNSLRVITYFVPVQHLAIILTFTGAYLFTKTFISLYVLVNPFK